MKKISILWLDNGFLIGNNNSHYIGSSKQKHLKVVNIKKHELILEKSENIGNKKRNSETQIINKYQFWDWTN